MAASLNKVMLIGRWTKDVELRYTQNGMAVANGTLAVDDPPKPDGTKQTQFIPVVFFAKTAETIANYGSKGRLVHVEGRWDTNKWTDQQGNNRYMTRVIAFTFRFLDSKNGGNQQKQAGDEASLLGEVDFEELLSGPEEDLPF